MVGPCRKECRQGFWWEDSFLWTISVSCMYPFSLSQKGLIFGPERREPCYCQHRWWDECWVAGKACWSRRGWTAQVIGLLPLAHFSCLGLQTPEPCLWGRVGGSTCRCQAGEALRRPAGAGCGLQCQGPWKGLWQQWQFGVPVCFCLGCHGICLWCLEVQSVSTCQFWTHAGCRLGWLIPGVEPRFWDFDRGARKRDWAPTWPLICQFED